MVLHGCGGDVYRMVDEYAPYAASNNIVMVFPKAIKCWDNYGAYTGKDYLTRDGFQMRFLKKIVDKLTSNSSKCNDRQE